MGSGWVSSGMMGCLAFGVGFLGGWKKFVL